MHVLLAGLGALVVGSGDFVGGTASRRDSPHGVATLSFLTGSVFLLVLVPWFGGQGDGRDYIWGAISGIGGAIGVFTLYRGMQRAPMGLVSPIAAVVGTAVPVIVGLALGEQLSAVAATGLALGVVAIVAVSLSPTDIAVHADARRSAIGHGLVTGLGFGILLTALALVDRGAGFGPVALSRTVSFGLLFLHGLMVRRAMIPASDVRLVAGAAGVLTSAGNLLYFMALSAGPIVVTAAVYALFPAATVVMARLIHHEHLTRMQLVGVLLALSAAVLLGVGSVG